MQYLELKKKYCLSSFASGIVYLWDANSHKTIQLESGLRYIYLILIHAWLFYSHSDQYLFTTNLLIDTDRDMYMQSHLTMFCQPWT